MKQRTKYLIIAVAAFGIFFTGGAMLVANAEPTTMEVSWSMSAEDQENLTFFRVINQNNVVVADNVPADARSAQFQTNGEAGAWRVESVLVVDSAEYLSDTSNSAIWSPECPECPVDPVPPTPTVYNITGTITAQPVQ